MGRVRGPIIPEAISVQMAADILDVSTATIRRWIRHRYLKAYRVGPILIRIPRSEIARIRTIRLSFQIEDERPVLPKI